MDGARGPLEQVTGIGHPAAGPADVIGIDAHAYKNSARFRRFQP